MQKHPSGCHRKKKRRGGTVQTTQEGPHDPAEEVLDLGRCSTVYNSPHTETAQGFIHTGICQNHSVLCDTMDEPGGHYAQCNKPVTEGQTPLEGSEIVIHREAGNKMVVALGRGEQGSEFQFC